MMGDSYLLGPEKPSQARVVPQAEAQPSLQDDGIRAAGDVPQSQAGITGLPDAQSPFEFRRLRRGNLMAAAESLLALIFLFLPWYGFAAAKVSDSVTHARRHRAAALLTAALLGTLVACSSGGHSPKSPATTRSTSASAVGTTSGPATQSSAPGLVTNLGDLQTTPDSEPYDTQGVAEVNGVSYPNSLGAQFCFGSNERKWTYVLGRKYSSLQGTIGLSDNSVATAKIRFQVLADGQPVYSKDLQVGQSAPLNVAVSNALQLELDTTLLTQDGGCGAATGVWAGIQAVGP
jgi:hypothetical protein